MTIQVEIKNNDSRENATIRVEVISPDINSISDTTYLNGGESITRHIWYGRNILISEANNGES